MGKLTTAYLQEYAAGDTFIETGTYHGDTVQVAKDFGFKKIHSVELHKDLFENCKKRFSGQEEIKIWEGDSVDCLQLILKSVQGQATFWLDAHASGPLPGGKYGGSPLVHELKEIGKHSVKNHVIIIDDMRLFGTGEWDFLSKDDVVDALIEINYKYRVTYIDGEIPGDIMVARVVE